MPDAPTVRREGVLPVLLQRGGGIRHGRATGAEPCKTKETCVSKGAASHAWCYLGQANVIQFIVK